MREMNLREARARLGELAEAAHHGETITLTKHGRPYALLTPLETAMQTTDTAARIIAGARERYAGSAETDGGADAFDFKISVEGIAPYGELYQETYAIANENHPLPGDDLDERKARAAVLWEQVLPELERYAAECRAAKFTGWSSASAGPIRRVNT